MKYLYSDLIKEGFSLTSYRIDYWIWFPFYLCIFAAAFFLFTYNSGYGYDASEYLVVAGMLAKKFDVYAMILSKSWGMYVYPYLAMSLNGGNSTHAAVTTLITFNAVLILSLLFKVMGETFSSLATWFAVWLVSIVCCFTEMNFLEPELLVGVLGLAGYWTIVKSRDVKLGPIFWAGFWIGCGMWFKVVAIFYLAGLGSFVCFEMLTNRATLINISKKLSAMVLGFVIPQVLAAIFFWKTGRLSDHVEWTYLFPFRGYPANTYWLAKFFLKLVWFHILLFVSLLLSLKRGLRRIIYHREVVLALFFAAFSLFALLKTQASHYFFPAALFLSIFISVVLSESLKLYLSTPSPIKLALPGLMILLIVIGVWLYRPDAIARFYTLRSYEAEANQRAFIQARVPEGRSLLAINGGVQVYLISNRLPNVPFPHTDIQTTYYISKHPEVLEEALDDENLTMVLYDNKRLAFDDPRFLETATIREALTRFESKLQQLYLPETNVGFPYKYWLRKPLKRNRVED